MAFKLKQLVSYFTAVVVFVILLLVSYGLKVTPHAQDISLLRTAEWSSESMSEHNKVVKSKANHSPAYKLIPDFHSLQLKDSLMTRLQKNQALVLHKEQVVTTDHPTVNRPQCNEEHCSEYLEGEDRQRFLECKNSVTNLSSEVIGGKCKFLDDKSRDAVALASFPGSGNTWVRGLLERITGLCTGAVYCDMSLRSSGFAGEYVRSGSALVVKTHRVAPVWVGSKLPRRLKKSEGRFGSAIFLVRNPFKAIVAEWNRMVSNDFKERTIHFDTHVKSAGQEWFGKNAQWNEFVHIYAQRWFNMISNWIHKNENHPLLLVEYEKLKNDTATEMQRILEFLNVPLNGDELQKCINEGFSKFHRNHNSEKFEHFTQEQKQWVNTAIISATRLSDTLNFAEDYLQPVH